MQTRKKIFAIVICGMAFSPPLFSASKSNQNNSNQQYNNSMMMSQDAQDACSNLSSDEQDFAAKLNDMNAMTFCAQMSPIQRQKAMQMTGSRGPSGTKMTPDDAVQSVMQNNTPQRSGGACPVK